MYAHHNTDRPEVLPCNRNNCRCGNDKNCMYYNNPDAAHYNYTAVHGTGDNQSPHYQCRNAAYDKFNEEGVYGDHAINGLGGYNDMHPYGEIDKPKGWYGPVDEPSYPATPTCSGYQGSGVACDDNHDYDKWDRYHKFRQFNKVGAAPQAQAQAQAQELALAAAVAEQDPLLRLGVEYEGGLDMPDVVVGYGGSEMNLTPYLTLLGIGAILFALNRRGVMNRNQLTVAAIAMLALFFFFQK